MASVRSHTFCCCLPVRFGVLVMSFGAMAVGGIVAVAGWIRVKDLPQHPLIQDVERALYVYSAMFSLLALVGAFGFIGALSKQKGLVTIFGTLLAVHLGISVATGIYAIYTVFKNTSEQALFDCIKGSTDPSEIESCNNGLKLLKIIIIVGYSVTWLIELWGCLIVNSYVKQLKEEEMAQAMSSTNPNAMSHYDPNGPYVPPVTTYTFAQPNQSHGYQA
ncbi:hypothetical protein R3P38DRAFT_2860038 [Favolaschia claudopus]|uniref:Tetraspanin n=1 Tax=Favolaschia claudopus TaxID=2862362 RepID=A0AAW0DJE0_9AGAR